VIGAERPGLELDRAAQERGGLGVLAAVGVGDRQVQVDERDAG
jgi:hypothetical protein